MADRDGFPQLARGAVVTVGTFDGVHLGHRDILRRVRERANVLGLPALLVTFRPHPLEVVNPSSAPMLLTPADEQLDALADSGPLLVAALPFTTSLAAYPAEAFVKRLLIERYHVRELVVGYDHGLGRGKEGDAGVLAKLGERHGFRVDVMRATLDPAGAPISSRTIRALVASGDVGRAALALGRPYSFRGLVIEGQRRGRALGYPTLNIRVGPSRKLLPLDGVYAVRAHSKRGVFGGMMNVGQRPTFGELDSTLEVHLFDTDGDWYGEAVSVDLIHRLRDTARFGGLEALKAQLEQDARNARIALTQA